MKIRKKQQKYRKRFCVRQTKGEFHTLVKELAFSDHELFFKMFRMLPGQLEKLLSWVEPKIVKANTRSGVISPDERLFMTHIQPFL